MVAPSTRAGYRVAAVAIIATVVLALAGAAIALVARNLTALFVVACLLGVVALGALVVGLLELRRHARSLAEHTAMLEQLASELSRANRAKGEFLANVSHELRTPLAAIVGFVEMLREGTYGTLSPRQAGPVERIESSANHLRELVDDILDLSKLAAARMEVHREPIAIRPFVLEVAGAMEPLLADKGLRISIGVGASLPRVRTDPTHLRQIVVNLLANAIKYTPDGTVSIRARLLDASSSEADRRELPSRLPAAHGVWVALAVQDTGVGIAATDQERVFEEFEQVDAGPRGDSMRRGTGLGLAISRRLAHLLGGEITLASAVGQGATFTLWLPVDPADLGPASAQVSAPGGGAP